jgi:hypothetical protein
LKNYGRRSIIWPPGRTSGKSVFVTKEVALR